ncbi:MAG: pyridoxamine 5'-phosphate oxidase family protein [Anaerolineae bacterium]|nr:pyridoxamine 5'-phosphate oxidase family protein [Anaerolineae bacterium]
MASWSEFAAAAPTLAAWGEQRFNRVRVAYLATVCEDGTPHVQPVSPVVCDHHLVLFLDPDSPKAQDLCMNGRYAMHSLIDNPAGIGGEFHITGQAVEVDDTDMRRRAVEAACYTPPAGSAMFELTVESAVAIDYTDGEISQDRWQGEAA